MFEWMTLEDIELREINQLQKDKHCAILLLGGTWVIQFIETESRMVVARSGGGEMKSCLRAYSFSFARWIEFWRCKCNFIEVIVAVKSLSCVRLTVTPWTAACRASLFFTISQSLLRFLSIESVMLSNHLMLCQPLLLLPSIFPSIRVFSSESAFGIRWPEFWSFSFNISPWASPSELWC